MKLLHFADVHLDAPFGWAGDELARRRRQAVRDAVRRLLELAVAEGVEAVLCGGDLFEQDRFTPDTAAFLQAELARVAPLPVYLAPGNHDWYGVRSLYHQVRWSPNVHVFRESRLTPVPLADGCTLWGAAHEESANTPGFLREFTVERGGVHLALFHGSERADLPRFGEGRAPHAPFDAGQIAATGLHHVLTGHYHVARDAPRHTYPGNPEPLTFGEQGPRGAVVLTVDPSGAVSRERHRVGGDEMHDVELDATGCASVQAVRDRLSDLLQDLRGCARVTVRGELEPTVDLRATDLRDAAPWMDTVLPRLDGLRPAYDEDSLRGEQTVRGQFVRDVLDAPDLDEAARRRVLATGLRALDGRPDLEVD
jgi:DNA repair exonuclease SbcCD nuclease subunit